MLSLWKQKPGVHKHIHAHIQRSSYKESMRYKFHSACERREMVNRFILMRRKNNQNYVDLALQLRGKKVVTSIGCQIINNTSDSSKHVK